MQQRLLFFILMLYVSCSPIIAGGIPLIYQSGDEVEKVKDLPIHDEFTIQAQDGNWYHADLGILHKQFSLFWIPLVNYGQEQYVLYTDKKIGIYDFTYTELTDSDVAYLQSMIGGIPSTPKLPFWDAWGGKILLLVVLIGFFVIYGENKE